MPVLDLIKKVKTQTLSFEKHPCRELEEEMKMHYLNGLSLVMNVDADIHAKETEYLSILINSFGLNEDLLDTFIAFAKNPDEKSVLDMMQAFATKTIKYNFMIDAMMIAIVDGKFVDEEHTLIGEYLQMFKMTETESENLRALYKMFHTQDGNGLYRYFRSSEKMFVDNFQYLIDYYKIDFAYEMEEEKKKILEFEWYKPKFKCGGLDFGYTHLMTKAVNNAQFCLFLNEILAEKEIFVEESMVWDRDKQDRINLSQSDINFENNVFVIAEWDKAKKATGMSKGFVNKFVNWVNVSLVTGYAKVWFRGADRDGDGAVWFKEINPKMQNEFCIRAYNGSFVLHPNSSSSFNIYRSEVTNDYTSADTGFRLMKNEE